MGFSNCDGCLETKIPGLTKLVVTGITKKKEKKGAQAKGVATQHRQSRGRERMASGKYEEATGKN